MPLPPALENSTSPTPTIRPTSDWFTLMLRRSWMRMDFTLRAINPSRLSMVSWSIL